MIELRRVAPVADPLCGAPEDATTLVITALGDFAASEGTAVSQSVGQARLDIDSFPAATRVVGVEVLGASGVLRAIGKTAPLELGALEDGAVVSVFMAPPRGTCPTGPPMHARTRPLVARAGQGALVAGGVGPDGPVIAIERYEPASGRFELVTEDHYGRGQHGLIGASMTALGAGHERVVIAGGALPAYQVYDATTGELGAALLMSPGRAFHAAVALGDGQVLLAGGCSALDERAQCPPGSALRTSSIIDVEASAVRDGPALAVARIGGVAVREGANSVLLVGGVDDAGVPVAAMERLFLDGSGSEVIDGAPGVAAPLLGGGAVLALRAGSSSAEAAVLPPGAAERVAAAPLPWPLADATLTPLEDGRVLVAGTRTDGRGAMLFYEPIRASFRALDASDALPGRDHGAVRLGDGSVLLIGGSDETGPVARAAVARPDLTGPYTSDVAISFGDVERAALLVPRDPAQTALVPAADRPARYVVTSSGGQGGLPSEWAVIAGPVVATGRLDARLGVTGGGVALLLGYRDPERHGAVVMIPGQPATLYRVDRGVPEVARGCDGEVIAAEDLAPGDLSAEIAMDMDERAVHVRVGGATVLRCDGIEPLGAGHVGIGAVGASGAAVAIEFLAVAR